jgi:hypothetical protein
MHPQPALCLGRGPTGRYLAEMDDFEDTKIIGEKQFLKAMVLSLSCHVTKNEYFHE